MAPAAPSKNPLLTESELHACLATVPGWSLRDGKLHREYRFADFPEAMGFMTRVAFDAERLGHHPNWSNVYNRVSVELWTHDADGITVLDFELAAAMNRRASGGQ